MRLVMTAVFATAWMFLSPFASAQHIACNGCSDPLYEDVVRYAGPGDHHVYDLSRGILRRYRVECGTGGWIQGAGDGPAESGAATSSGPVTLGEQSAAYCTTPPTVALIPNDTAVENAFTLLRQAYLETQGTLAKDLVIDYGDLGFPFPAAPSAFDVVRDANLRAMIGDRLNNANFGIMSRAGLFYLAAAGDALLGFRDAISITVTIRMPNGTTVRYLWVRAGAGAGATYLKGQSRTMGGQLIPEAENNRDNAGTWFGNPPTGAEEDLSEMPGHLAWLGARLQEIGGNNVRVECRWDGSTAGGSLVCTIVGRP